MAVQRVWQNLSVSLRVRVLFLRGDNQTNEGFTRAVLALGDLE